MNAKMIITVPIDQIPKEVDKLLYSLIIKLEVICKDAQNIVNDNDIDNKILAIDSIRKKLTLLDLNYEDCYSILVGYSKYLFEKNNSSIEQDIHDNSKNE